MLVTEIIKLFARFPGNSAAILRHFKNTGSKIAGYNAFKNEIENLQVKELLPDLKGFYFGNSLDDMYEVVKNMEMPFLFVLLPDDVISGDTIFNINIKSEVTFSILHENMNRHRDNFERLLIEESCQKIAYDILEHFMDQRESCYLLRAFDSSNIRMVYDQAFGCVGWTTMVNFNFARNA